MSVAVEQFPERLRPMRSDDIDGVFTIESVAHAYPWTRGIFHDCLRAGYQCWVLERVGGPIAYAILSLAPDEAHLLNLCVHPACQRRGLGRRLLGHMRELGRQWGCTSLLLEVRPSNQGAIALYRSEGFREVGRRKAYYPAPGGREDALILAVDITARNDP